MYISIPDTLFENSHSYFENFLPRAPHMIAENYIKTAEDLSDEKLHDRYPVAGSRCTG